MEHYQLVHMNKEQSEKLTRELENSIKTHYLKNVLLSYLTTNEASVQQNLVKVIIQAMQFNEEETERVLAFQEESQRSVVSKVSTHALGLTLTMFVVDRWLLLRIY